MGGRGRKERKGRKGERRRKRKKFLYQVYIYSFLLFQPHKNLKLNSSLFKINSGLFQSN
jgi:hypothetical protein